MIHEFADVKSNNIGKGTQIWQFSIVLAGAKIGENCNVNCHTFIENDVVIGDDVTIKSGVYLWDGIRIDSNVFIGPNATFTNNKYPRSKQYPSRHIGAHVKKFASIGANATILDVEIGEYAIVGAGAVVTKNIKPHEIVVGNPAVHIGWADYSGKRLVKEQDKWISSEGLIFQVVNGYLKEITK